MWGGDAAVIDESGAIRHRGAGEIIIRSPSMMSGYLDRPDLTAAALHQGWYRTGDRGSIDEHGRIWLTGRIKDEINRAGFKVQPAEIDAMLERHPAVAEACVFGISDPLGGEAVAAAIRLKTAAAASPQSLQAWCLERVRREAVPERWFLVSEIPRTARGKVSRDAVRRLLVEQPVAGAVNGDVAAAAPCAADPAIAAVAPTVRTAVELAWTEVLGRDSCIADLPLNQAGGDSLDAMRMWLLIEKTFGKRLLMDVLDPIQHRASYRPRLSSSSARLPAEPSQRRSP